MKKTDRKVDVTVDVAAVMRELRLFAQFVVGLIVLLAMR